MNNLKSILRNFTVAILAVSMTLIASAQRDPSYMASEVIREAQRIQELITREADYMSERQLSQVRNKLSEIREIVRGGGSHPPPYPPPQPPQYGSVSVRGDIESYSFSFDVRDIQDLHNQCVAFVNSKGLQSVDDIRVSVNLDSIRTLRNNQTYWKGANQICMQINEVAKQKGLRVSYDNQHTVFGSIESYEFKFTGYNKSDAFRQCESFVNAKGLQSVDDIVRVTNFGPERVLRNNQSYWKGSLEICQQVLAEVP